MGARPAQVLVPDQVQDLDLDQVLDLVRNLELLQDQDLVHNLELLQDLVQDYDMYQQLVQEQEQGEAIFL